MIKNDLATAWRHRANKPLFSVTNIFRFGLVSGILILLFVSGELYYDARLTDGDHTAYYSPERPPFLIVRSAGRMMKALGDCTPDQVGARLLQ